MSRKRLLVVGVLLVALVFALPAYARDFTIAMVVKGAGNPFFEACRKGGEEATGELGLNFIFQAPATPTSEGQIELIDALIAQQVDAILVSANDPDALVPMLRRAMDRGIIVVAFDSGVAPAGRHLFLNQADMELIGRIQVQMLAEMIDGEGEIAILSATSTMANQNTWIQWMQEELKEPEYAKMDLVAIVYGDDLREKSYNEALASSVPSEPQGYHFPDHGRFGRDGPCPGGSRLIWQDCPDRTRLPSEMAEYIRNGTSEAIALWNPIDLGYVSTYMAHGLLTGTLKGEIGAVVNVGRMGERTITEAADGGLEVVLGAPFVFDIDNIDEWADVY